MTTIKQIAKDPRKALSQLEKELGVESGGLLADMSNLGEAGEDWSKHLPYGVAAAYYGDASARAQFEEHVNSCTYCKELLQTIHPTDVDAFVERAIEADELTVPVGTAIPARAARTSSAPARELSGRVTQWTNRVAPFALAASLVMFVFGGWSLQRSRTTIPARASASNLCIADGGDPAGCTLLRQAADVRTTDPQLARALLVAGLSQTGAQEPTLRGVTAVLDPATPLPEIFVRVSANAGKDQRPSPRSAAILTAAHSNFKSGRPIAGYEQILAYLKESETNEASARAFEKAFVQPVRTSSGAKEPTEQLAEITGWVGDVKIGSSSLKMQNDPGKTEIIPAGQTVRLVTEIQGAPTHTPVSVVWFGPDNQELRKETSWTAEGVSSIAFAVADTASWQTGNYRAELWVADEKVKQQAFAITHAVDTSKNAADPEHPVEYGAQANRDAPEKDIHR